MSEARRVVAEPALLSGVRTTERSQIEQSQIERSDEHTPAEQKVECGDNALEALVREHARLVYRIAFAVLRRHHDAEDAAQETFLRVLRYSAKLAAVENPKTWLARIAWRVAVDRSKRRECRRETSLEDSEPVAAQALSSETLADDTVQGAQVGAAIEKLIAALPEKLRQPLILSAIEEMTPREIAATLGINEAAVRSRVFRARQILREKLAAQTAGKQVKL